MAFVTLDAWDSVAPGLKAVIDADQVTAVVDNPQTPQPTCNVYMNSATVLVRGRAEEVWALVQAERTKG